MVRTLLLMLLIILFSNYSKGQETSEKMNFYYDFDKQGGYIEIFDQDFNKGGSTIVKGFVSKNLANNWLLITTPIANNFPILYCLEDKLYIYNIETGKYNCYSKTIFKIDISNKGKPCPKVAFFATGVEDKNLFLAEFSELNYNQKKSTIEANGDNLFVVTHKDSKYVYNFKISNFSVIKSLKVKCDDEVVFKYAGYQRNEIQKKDLRFEDVKKKLIDYTERLKQTSKIYEVEIDESKNSNQVINTYQKFISYLLITQGVSLLKPNEIDEYKKNIIKYNENYLFSTISFYKMFENSEMLNNWLEMFAESD